MNPSYQKELNLSHSSHYPFVANKSAKGTVYSFTTAGNFTYKLVFTSDADYLTDYPFAESVFSFAIETDEIGPKDPLIKNTVVFALSQVFKVLPDLIITYICSAADEKQRHRRILFGQWFREYGNGFARLTHTDKEQIYSAAIFRADHPHRQLIEDSFNGIYADK